MLFVFTCTATTEVFMLLILANFGTSNVSWAADSPYYAYETELLDQLLNTSTYNPSVAPVMNVSTGHADGVTVYINFELTNVLEMNEKEGYMASVFRPSVVWHDERLKWADDSVVEQIYVDANKLWLPDLTTYNSIHSAENEQALHPHAVVQRDGKVIFVPIKHLKTSCEFDMQGFPFDHHWCTIMLGSWRYDTSKVLLEASKKLGLSSFTAHSDWNLTDSWIDVAHKTYPCCEPLRYTSITINLKFTRRGSYYYRLFVAPAALCMFVIPVIHFLPPNSNEKLTLCGLILVGVVIMFEMVEEYFPAFSLTAIPLILHYYTALLILLFMSMFTSCLSIMIGNGLSKSKRVPVILRRFCLDKLGYVCCASGRTKRYDYELLNLEKSLSEHAGGISDEDDTTEMEEVGDNRERTESGTSREGLVNGRVQVNESNDITKVLKTLINELQYTRYKEQIRTEWMQLAMVIDRTCGLLLLTLAVILTAVITVHHNDWS